MKLYKRAGSDFWWFKFKLHGRTIRESTKETNQRKAEGLAAGRRSQILRVEAGLEEDPKAIEEKRVAEENKRAEEEKIPFFCEYADTWLSTYAKVHCKFATHRLYTQVVEQHLKPAFGGKRIDSIGRSDVKAFISAKVDQVSKATVRNIMAPFREMMSHAVDDGLILTSSASKLGRFSKETSARANAKEIVPYTAEEVQKLLLKAQELDFEVYAFMLTAVLTGMRLGELLGFQWGDLDGHNQCIHVKRAVSRRRIETPKNHLQRRIDLADELGKVLDELRRRRKQEWFKRGAAVPDWVFCNQDGSYLNEYNFRTRKFYPLLEKAKLRRVRLHDLRHTFASLHLQNGESVVYVKEQMGHHSIQVTVDLYGHLIPGANRAAANRLQATFVPKAAASNS